MPRDNEVMGFNSTGCEALFLFLSYQQCVLNQVPYGPEKHLTWNYQAESNAPLSLALTVEKPENDNLNYKVKKHNINSLPSLLELAVEWPQGDQLILSHEINNFKLRALHKPT